MTSKSRLSARVAAPVLVFGLGFVAAAHATLPTPVITRADPNPIYPGATPTDGNGRIALKLIGHDLGPNDGDNGHPAGYRGGYQHIFIRGVSADSKAGGWVECRDDPCTPYGSTGVARDQINLGIVPNVVSQPGSHLQIKLWVSFGADVSNDPSETHAEASGWSPIYTIDVARPGQAAAAPVVLKMSPSQIGIDTNTNWYIRLIGSDICKSSSRIVFNGDMGSAVQVYPERCGTDGSDYPSGTQLYDVELPAALRKPGTVAVRVHNDAGDSGTSSVTINQVYHKLNGVHLPDITAPSQQIAPGQAQPPIRKKP